MLHNNARYEVEAQSSHHVILLVTSYESGAGRRLCFQVIVAHHATMQGIAGK